MIARFSSCDSVCDFTSGNLSFMVNSANLSCSGPNMTEEFLWPIVVLKYSSAMAVLPAPLRPERPTDLKADTSLSSKARFQLWKDVKTVEESQDS